MLVHTTLAQFLHVAKDSHLVSDLHEAEVFECSHHAGRVRIIGIDDEMIVFCLRQLGTVVAWYIAVQSLSDGFCGHFEVTTYRNGRQGILYIVSTYQMRVYIVLASLMRPLER